jgi:hypothetical protein
VTKPRGAATSIATELLDPLRPTLVAGNLEVPELARRVFIAEHSRPGSAAGAPVRLQGSLNNHGDGAWSPAVMAVWAAASRTGKQSDVSMHHAVPICARDTIDSEAPKRFFVTVVPRYTPDGGHVWTRCTAV